MALSSLLQLGLRNILCQGDPDLLTTELYLFFILLCSICITTKRNKESLSSVKYTSECNYCYVVHNYMLKSTLTYNFRLFYGIYY